LKKAIFLILTLSIVTVAVILLQKSSSSDKEESRGVIATIYPLYYITKEIVGDEVEVKRLIKAGSEIHSFSPTPKDMVELSNSDILITLGDRLEPWVGKLSNATDVEILPLADSLDLIHHKEHIDPHLWLDFKNDIAMVDIIEKRLSKLYPSSSEIFAKNAKSLKDKFQNIDSRYSDGLKECKQDTILVTHNAFGYMQRVYGFKSISIMGIFAHSRPNASKIALLSDEIKKKSIKVLFFDPISSNKSASQLATDMKLTLLPLYPLGNISIDDEKRGDDMFKLLSKNLTSLQRGLECL